MSKVGRSDLPNSAGEVLDAIRRLPLISPAELTGGRAFLVISPHPDDDALGVGGLIAASRQAGHRAGVVVLTDGSSSHPNSKLFPRQRLVELRRSEALLAADALGLSVSDVYLLGLQDGHAPTEGALFEAAVDRLERVVRAIDAASVFTTWEHDPHGDHKAAFAMAIALHQRLPHLKVWAYPIWSWHLDPSETLTGGETTGVRVDVTPWLSRKRAAIAAHASQMTNLINDDEQGFRFNAETLAPFQTSFEYFICTR